MALHLGHPVYKQGKVIILFFCENMLAPSCSYVKYTGRCNLTSRPRLLYTLYDKIGLNILYLECVGIILMECVVGLTEKTLQYVFISTVQTL